MYDMSVWSRYSNSIVRKITVTQNRYSGVLHGPWLSGLNIQKPLMCEDEVDCDKNIQIPAVNVEFVA